VAIVIITDNARLPPTRWVRPLDRAPPGLIATAKMASATSGGGVRRTISASATTGSNTSCASVIRTRLRG
jgi:hypothetical protein